MPDELLHLIARKARALAARDHWIIDVSHGIVPYLAPQPVARDTQLLHLIRQNLSGHPRNAAFFNDVRNDVALHTVDSRMSPWFRFLCTLPFISDRAHLLEREAWVCGGGALLWGAVRGGLDHARPALVRSWTRTLRSARPSRSAQVRGAVGALLGTAGFVMGSHLLVSDSSPSLRNDGAEQAGWPPTRLYVYWAALGGLAATPYMVLPSLLVAYAHVRHTPVLPVAHLLPFPIAHELIW